MAVLFIVTLFLAYVSLGLPDSALGVAWPYARVELFASVDYAGYLAFLITVCGMVSSVLSLKFVKKLGANKIVALSCLLTGSAMLLFSFVKNKYLLLPLCLPLGFGAGAVDAVLNDYVSRHYASKIMNWLHACWGIGAMISPLIMTAGINFGSWRYGYMTVGAIQLLLAILFFSTLKLWNRKEIKNGYKDLLPPAAPGITFKNLAPWLSVITFFFYVGIEAACGLWLNTLLYEYRGFDTNLSGLTVSVYYGSIMAGRILIGFFSNKLGNRAAVRLGILIALSGGVMLIFDQKYLNIISVFLIGIGFAPIYPSMMHETPRRFSREVSLRTIGYQMAAASLGSMVFSPAVGYIGSKTTMNILPYVVIAGLLAIIAATEILNARTKVSKIRQSL